MKRATDLNHLKDYNLKQEAPPHVYVAGYCDTDTFEWKIVKDPYTDLPGVQFYTGNWLGGEKGKGGVSYEDRNAFCFETQMYPDSVNHPQFPAPVVKAGTAHVTRTSYRFYIGK